MKQKILWIALAIMSLLNNSIQAQDMIITQEGTYDLPESWIIPTGVISTEYKSIHVASEVNLSNVWVKTGLTGLSNHFPDGYPEVSTYIAQQKIPLLLEGSYAMLGDGGKIRFKVTKVTATVAVTGVALNQTSLSKTVGDAAVTLMATVAPANATNQNVSWSTSNASVATVSNGVVNFVGVGSAVITVTTEDGNKTATCNVTVTAAPVAVISVKLNVMEKTLSPGETYQLSYTVLPENAANKNVTWKSENSSIITVSSMGFVTAKGEGTAKVVVTTVDGNKSDYCTFIVKSETISVTGISLNKTSLTLSVGSSEKLVATVTPTNATNKGIVWTTSDATVASIDSDGTVTAASNGVATITATTQDGGYTATCEVTVSGTVGIEETDTPALSIYAAPSGVKIEGMPFKRIEIYSMEGRIVAAKNAHSTEELIPLSQRGAYVVRVYVETKIITKKIYIK
ncbi:Ig-like domain-containing protein [Parabacteroides sp. OttesenSCG-928-N08]|nr:Ig-like domain-containing protein [Parabacteroides sp. OttesenSCG-928-N08]